MRGEASAYAALGLKPGADSATIDAAYRKLIKLYHPDRSGGDAERAAEINRAYRELRGRPAPVDAFNFGDDDRDERSSPAWVRAVVVLMIALAAFLFATGPGGAWMRDWAARSAPARPLAPGASGKRTADPMTAPLDHVAVDKAIADAVRINRSGDGAALLSESRACHRALRDTPAVRQLDRCAAFDDAIVELQDRAPGWDGGPFSQPAVARRQWAAASALSNDYLAVDGRLDRIRLHVELALAPRNPAPAISIPEMANEADVTVGPDEPAETNAD
jgi:hypothetical protein